MLRIRNADGSTQIIEKGQFVELCDLDGRVAQVSFITPDGSIRVISSREPDAQRYQAMFQKCGVTLCSVTKLNL